MMNWFRSILRPTPRPPLRNAERGRALVALLVVLVAACGGPRSEALGTDGHPDLRGEVQAFYDWYLSDTHEGRTVGTVLIERPQVLSDELLALLEADRRCVADSQAICNLDFDPFLNAQDWCGPFQVGDQHPDSGVVAFNVYTTCEGKRAEVPRLQVIVESRDSGWRFVNIAYGMEGTDLLALLRRPVAR
jgi:hypothetical protein